MRDVLGRRKKERGVALTELALLFPIMFGLFLGFVQVVIYMQSRTATQYAAFAAARAFQVYGARTLADIHYPRVSTLTELTNGNQTIAEAAAEKVIFESLLWEHRKIESSSQTLTLDRTYRDGSQVGYDAAPQGEGVVKVRFMGCTGAGDCNSVVGPGNILPGLEVTYCLPIVFPGIDFLFTMTKQEIPCHVSTAGRSYSGIGITYRVQLGREPVEL